MVFPIDCVSRVTYPVVMQQSTQPICGILAIAFAFSCFIAKDCTQIVFDTTLAANHLKNCISLREIRPLLVKPTNSNLDFSVHTYIADQICQKEHYRIRQKRHRDGSSSTDEAVKQQRDKDIIQHSRGRRSLYESNNKGRRTDNNTERDKAHWMNLRNKR